MSARQYSSIAVDTTITAGINAAVGSCVVAAATGFPSAPFTMVLDYGTASQEIVEVTVVAGTTLTISRGMDGSTAASHAISAPISHKATARDYRDTQTHIFAASAVHGLAGTVVGTSDSQTLSNKTLTAPTINGATLTGTLSGGTVNPTTLQQNSVAVVTTSGGQTLTSKTLTAPNIATIVNSGTLTLPTSNDTLVGRATTDTLTNKTLTAPVIATIANSGTLTLPTGADTLVGRATTDTLTNKTLTSPAINGGTTNATSLQQGSVAAQIYRIPSQTATLTSGNVTTSGTTALTLVTLGAITGDGATKVKIDFSGFTNTGSVADDIFDYKIVDSVAGTLATFRYRSGGAAKNDVLPSGFYVDTPSAASHTYSVTVTRASGTGTLIVSNSAGFPFSAVVEQFGN